MSLTVMQKYEMMEHNKYITMTFKQIVNDVKQISGVGRNVSRASVGTSVLVSDCNISRYIVEGQYERESESYIPTSLISSFAI